MPENEPIEKADEINEVAEIVVKRGRARPRKEKLIEEKKPPSRPKKLGPMRENKAPW